MAKDYSMKIPRKLADTFQKFIDNNPELGYRKVSQYIQHILQDKAGEIIKKNYTIGKSESKIIKLESGNYTKEELEEMLKKFD